MIVLVGLSSAIGCEETPRPLVPKRTDQEKAEEYAKELHASIWHRLALMPAVAQNKFHHQRPIRDKAREAELQETFRMQALNRGIHPDFAEQVIRGQIKAAVVIQEQLYEQWKAQPPPEDVLLRDLVQDLRPNIDLTTERLLAALQLLGGVPNELEHAIEHAYARRTPLPPLVPEEAWDLAWAPLREAPRNYMPGREVLGRIPSFRSTLPENQPLLPEFVPE